MGLSGESAGDGNQMMNARLITLPEVGGEASDFCVGCSHNPPFLLPSSHRKLPEFHLEGEILFPCRSQSTVSNSGAGVSGRERRQSCTAVDESTCLCLSVSLPLSISLCCQWHMLVEYLRPPSANCAGAELLTQQRVCTFQRDYVF